LDALDRQTMRNELEVIVVDNGSTDGSFELAQARADVVDQITGGRGSSLARNRALALATSPHLLTLDADTWPAASDWAMRHVMALEAAAPDVLATAGPLVPAPSTDRYAMRMDITPHVHLVAHAPPYAVNGSACYRSQLLRDIGGYPNIGANDSGVGRSARAHGLRYVWVPKAVSYHRNGVGLKAYLAQMRKIGQYVAEQEPPPPHWGRWLASQTRHALARSRPAARGDLREATIGVLAVIAQTRGAVATWRVDID
jgi:glycosyltransferase involved in cell wall biosynthesis